MKEKDLFYTPTLLALLTVSAYFFADTVDTMIGMALFASTGPGGRQERYQVTARPSRELSDFAGVLDRGLFGDGGKPSTGPVAAPAVEYKLIGTVEGDAFAGAVLADRAGQAFYRINGKLPDGSTVIKVLRDKVTLRLSDGTTVDIERADDSKIVPIARNMSSSVKSLPGNKFLVDQRAVLASTENMSQILTQARAVPYMEQGKIAGFRVSSIVPNSIYALIGLQNGDVIRQINGQALDDPGKFFQLYQGLRNERNISIDLLRNGQPQTMTYDIR